MELNSLWGQFAFEFCLLGLGYFNKSQYHPLPYPSDIIALWQNLTEFQNTSHVSSPKTIYVINETCLTSMLEQVVSVQKKENNWLVAPFSIAYAAVTALGLLGNGMVILAVVRKKEMRTHRNVLITNLAISNLLLSSIIYVMLWKPSIDQVFEYGRFFCKVANAFPAQNVFCSTLTICLMSVDRYLTVKRTRFQSTSVQTNWFKALVMPVSIWVVSLALSVPFFIFYDLATWPNALMNVLVAPNVTKDFSVITCQFGPRLGENEKFLVSTLTGVYQSLFLYAVPLVVLVIFNWKLTSFLKQHDRNSMASNACTPGSRTQTFTPGSRAESVSVSAATIHQVNNNNVMRRTQAERRRNRTSALLFAMAASYGVLWLPYTIMSVLMDFRAIPENHQTTKRLDYSAKLLSMLSTCVNPVLYGYLNTNFNREFREIFWQIVAILRRCCQCKKRNLGELSGKVSKENNRKRQKATDIQKQSNAILLNSSTGRSPTDVTPLTTVLVAQNGVNTKLLPDIKEANEELSFSETTKAVAV